MRRPPPGCGPRSRPPSRATRTRCGTASRSTASCPPSAPREAAARAVASGCRTIKIKVAAAGRGWTTTWRGSRPCARPSLRPGSGWTPTAAGASPRRGRRRCANWRRWASSTPSSRAPPSRTWPRCAPWTWACRSPQTSRSGARGPAAGARRRGRRHRGAQGPAARRGPGLPATWPRNWGCRWWSPARWRPPSACGPGWRWPPPCPSCPTPAGSRRGGCWTATWCRGRWCPSPGLPPSATSRRIRSAAGAARAGPELTRFWLDRWERVRRIVEEGALSSIELGIGGRRRPPRHGRHRRRARARVAQRRPRAGRATGRTGRRPRCGCTCASTSGSPGSPRSGWRRSPAGPSPSSPPRAPRWPTSAPPPWRPAPPACRWC